MKRFFLLGILILLLCFLIYLFFQCEFEKDGFLQISSFLNLPVCKPSPSDFASLITGLAAIVAALIAFYAIASQNQAEDRRYQKQTDIQILQNEYELSLRMFNTAALVSADIKSIVDRIKDLKLNDDEVLQLATAAKTNDYCIMEINENYMNNFHSMISGMVFGSKELTKAVFKWYTTGKGLMDQSNYFSKHYAVMDHSEREMQIGMLIALYKQLVNLGDSLMPKLDSEADLYFSYCSRTNKFIRENMGNLEGIKL